MQVIYADVLFLINFCMDLIALWFSGGVLHLPRRRGALILACIIGAIYSVLSAVFSGNPTLSILIAIGVALLICYVAYGRECRRRVFFAVAAIFLGVSWLLGGMITAFYSLLEHFFRDREEIFAVLTGGEGRLILFFALVLVAVSFVGLFRALLGEHGHRKTARIRIKTRDRHVTVTGFVDTGNTLREPLSGRACVIVDPCAVAGALPEDVLAFSASGGLDPDCLSAESKRRIRLVPAESLGGHSLLVGYLPDRLEILSEKEEGQKRSVDAVIVLEDRGGSFGGYDAILPPVLMI